MPAPSIFPVYFGDQHRASDGNAQRNQSHSHSQSASGDVPVPHGAHGRAKANQGSDEYPETENNRKQDLHGLSFLVQFADRPHCGGHNRKRSDNPD
jgi:hypothetical protein